VVEAGNSACYYKRDSDELVRKAVGGAEVACSVQREKREPAIAAANVCLTSLHSIPCLWS
jgi:hypothetical protein